MAGPSDYRNPSFFAASRRDHHFDHVYNPIRCSDVSLYHGRIVDAHAEVGYRALNTSISCRRRVLQSDHFSRPICASRDAVEHGFAKFIGGGSLQLECATAWIGDRLAARREGRKPITDFGDSIKPDVFANATRTLNNPIQFPRLGRATIEDCHKKSGPASAGPRLSLPLRIAVRELARRAGTSQGTCQWHTRCTASYRRAEASRS